MEMVNTILPVILYVLGAVLLVVLIILGIKLISTVNRVNKIADDIENKVQSFDNVFTFIEVMTDKLSFLGDKMIDGVVTLIGKMVSKKKKKREEDDEYDEY